ncbi:hypothetical protein PVK06_024753 [Gossypium arboreum]|uniref:Uncharacterized protein n=1 Tax=Gossypium arboreum TaxID=29729 RepID=A0ABR0PF01_GOSAR|nr:hypothetical protein PVK06_024753 [Gossypium arboreum]
MDYLVFLGQTTIDVIKAKKDWARKSFVRLAPDYISLDSRGNRGGSDEEEPEFRGRLLGESGKNGVFKIVDEREIGVVSRKYEIHDRKMMVRIRSCGKKSNSRKDLGRGWMTLRIEL